MDWDAKIALEFDRAARARARGNEGQARVCARRAAGLAIREYFARHELAARSASAVDLLRQLREDSTLPAELVTQIDHLTQAVDLEFRLPPGVDLLEDARQLRQQLAQR